jgi:hypothetical protein
VAPLTNPSQMCPTLSESTKRCWATRSTFRITKATMCYSWIQIPTCTIGRTCEETTISCWSPSKMRLRKDTSMNRTSCTSIRSANYSSSRISHGTSRVRLTCTDEGISLGNSCRMRPQITRAMCSTVS